MKLYSELAGWWPLVSAPEDYLEEAGYFRDLLLEACRPQTVLELGSGGGNNAYHMKQNFRLTLVDRSAEMLAVSRTLNPDCEHFEGDMRSVRFDREFDAVFIHDAVMYLTTEHDLQSTLETAFLHCRPGGALLIAPDAFCETFTPEVSTGGHDKGARSLRYMQWDHPPQPGATTFAVDYAYMLREGDGPVELVHDHHELGIFPRQRWLDLCRQAGFEPRIRTVVHSEFAPRESELLLCSRP